MAKIQPGETIGELSLAQIDGSQFNLAQVAGKRCLLGFFRFASCPFCNLRIHHLVKQSEQWPEDFTVIAIFDSPLADLQRHAEGHHAPFPILADPENRYYRQFGVERSWLKSLKGMILRFPTLLYAMVVKGYWPFPIRGKMNTIPLDILVNERGIVEQVYYGADEGDHMPLDQVLAFAKDAGA